MLLDWWYYCFCQHSTIHISLIAHVFFCFSSSVCEYYLSAGKQTRSSELFWSCCLFLWQPGDLSDCPSFVAMSLPPFTNNRLRGAQQVKVTNSTPKPASRPPSQLLDSSLCVGGHRRILLPLENVLIFPQRMSFVGRGAQIRPHSVSV